MAHSQTPMNNSTRRISLVVPQPSGGIAAKMSASLNGPIQTSSVDGRRKGVSDKKKKSTGKIDLASSIERIGGHKFSITGYQSQVGAPISINMIKDHSTQKKKPQNKEKSQVGSRNDSIQQKGSKIQIISQSIADSHDQLSKLRNQTLSPPPTSKQNKITANLQLSKSNQKNDAAQKSNKRLNYLKSLVKKQQQKSLSRDFTNALMNTNISKTSQFQLFKSQNQSNSNNTVMMSQSGYINNMSAMHNNSLSPNNRTLQSSQKKKKKTTLIKKKKEDNPLMASLQSFKPPINAKNLPNLLQSSMQIKSGTFHSIMNDSKESSQLRHPAKVVSQGQPIIQVSKEVSQKRKQLRSNTQERVLRMAEESIQQIDQELDFTNKKMFNTVQNSMMESTKKNYQSQQVQSEYLNKENSKKIQPHMSINLSDSKQQPIFKIENLGFLNKTFTDILENLQQNQTTNDHSQIQQKKQQANMTLIKSQLELIKSSYESVIKKLSDGQQNSVTQAQSARQNIAQRLLSDRQNEEEMATATNSHNDCFSASSTFRTNKANISQQQLQQRIIELENQNLQLSTSLSQKQEVINQQQETISLLTKQGKTQDAGIQTVDFEEEPQITKRKTDLLIDNEQLRRQLQKLEKRISYHKNKENKFLFFLYQLQNQGIPVNEIYEKEGIKDIPTVRFAEIMGEENMPNTNQSSLMFSFYSDDSYEPLDIGIDPCKTKKKPSVIPSLNLNNLPEYESSSDEEGDDQQKDNSNMNMAAQRNMTTQDYEQSMKYIENFYNKCGGQPNEDEEEGEEFIMCQANNGSSILMFEKEESQIHNAQYNQLNPGSLMDSDFCYSIDKNSKRQSNSKDLKSC